MIVQRDFAADSAFWLKRTIADTIFAADVSIQETLADKAKELDIPVPALRNGA